MPDVTRRREGKLKPRPKLAHIFPREEHSHYVEPRWVSAALFREERFRGQIHDPSCGFGHVVVSARQAGHDATAADIVDRGFKGTQIRDFITDDRRYANIVCNPPYEVIETFGPHAVAASRGKAALVFPVARLNAAGDKWLKGLPLARIWFISPRPSMPPGWRFREYEATGKEPSSGRVDFAWLVFRHGHRGSPTSDWLYRDGRRRP